MDAMERVLGWEVEQEIMEVQAALEGGFEAPAVAQEHEGVELFSTPDDFAVLEAELNRSSPVEVTSTPGLPREGREPPS